MHKYILFYFIFLNNFANSIVINDYVFNKYGGNLQHKDMTYVNPYTVLAKDSFNDQYLAVGSIYVSNSNWCTGVWLANTLDDKHSIILTAAHCILNKAETGRTRFAFRDYWGWLVAQDGTYYKLPKSLNTDGTTYSGDLAILKLEKMRDIIGPDGKPISPPILNDVEDEGNKPVEFVGYGYWGTQTGGVRTRWKLSSPVNRRARGQSVINQDGGNFTSFVIAGFSEENNQQWSRIALGDSGAPWWQSGKEGNHYIIGITSGFSELGSYATKVETYKDWIKSIAPEVRWRSKHGCWWLNYEDSQWRWVTYTRLQDQIECLKANKCHEGGGCYKWDTYPEM